MSFAAQKKSGWKKVEIVHTPVLLNECLKFLSPIGEPFEKDAFMIDSTFLDKDLFDRRRDLVAQLRGISR